MNRSAHIRQLLNVFGPLSLDEIADQCESQSRALVAKTVWDMERNGILGRRGEAFVIAREIVSKSEQARNLPRLAPRTGAVFYADSREGRDAKMWQSLLNDVPAYTRGNLSAVVRTCGVAA